MNPNKLLIKQRLTNEKVCDFFYYILFGSGGLSLLPRASGRNTPMLPDTDCGLWLSEGEALISLWLLIFYVGNDSQLPHRGVRCVPLPTTALLHLSPSLPLLLLITDDRSNTAIQVGFDRIPPRWWDIHIDLHLRGFNALLIFPGNLTSSS